MSALSHRSHQAVLSALIAALVMVALPAAAGAQPADAHGVPAAPVNAPGTDVAAPDQQAPRTELERSGISVDSRDQVSRPAAVGPAPQADATGPIGGTDESGPAIGLLGLIVLALGLGGIAFASWLAVSRKRGRATG